MYVLSYVLPGIAVLACACVYGADFFAAIVLRSALSHVDDDTLTSTMGHVHQYGDRRMPVPFAIGVATSASGAAVAMLAGRPVTAVASGVAVIALVTWIAIYFRVSVPVNRELTSSALAGRTPHNARSLQRRWDSVVPIRLGLQLIAVGSLCVALTLR